MQTLWQKLWLLPFPLLYTACQGSICQLSDTAMIRCGYHGALCKSASGCMNVFLCVYYSIEHAACIDFAHVRQSVMLQAGGSTEPQPPIHSARNAHKTNKNANERDSFLHCFSVRIQFVYAFLRFT